MTEILSWNLSREMECIQYASKELLNSKEIAMTAVKQNGNSIQYVGEDCQRDREIVLEAVKRNGECLEFLRSQFAKDKEIVMEAAKQKGFQFKFVDESLRGDGEIIMEMVKRYGLSLRFAKNHLLMEKKEFFMMAILNNREAMKYVVNGLKEVQEIVWISIFQFRTIESMRNKDLKFQFEN
jgi:hypothetical protein